MSNLEKGIEIISFVLLFSPFVALVSVAVFLFTRSGDSLRRQQRAYLDRLERKANNE